MSCTNSHFWWPSEYVLAFGVDETVASWWREERSAKDIKVEHLVGRVQTISAY